MSPGKGCCGCFLIKAILPFPTGVGVVVGVGVGVGVVPASIDPGIEKNVAARAQANLTTSEGAEFREAIFAFMEWVSQRGHRP